MTIKIMAQDTKDRIADLERQKIGLADQLDNMSYFKSFNEKNDARILEVEQEISEIDDTIKKLVVNTTPQHSLARRGRGHDK
jgi:hypothetical protein